MKLVPMAVTRRVARTVLQSKASSPTVLFGIGIVGVIGGAVLACRATLELEDVLTQVEKDRLDFQQSPSYANQKKQAALYARGVYKVAKLYAPSVAVGVVGIASLTGSHRTLTRRNVALTAAYAAVERGFADYRQRVLDDVGEEKESEYRFPTQMAELEDPETGKKIKARVLKPGAESIYARFFDEGNRNYQSAPGYNMMFLRSQQSYMNDMLHARGHVFLNDVYDAIGIDRTKAGCVVGWVISDIGDNWIDFGIFDGENERKRAFVNGYENSILLDFNVDGVVYDKI